MNLSIHPASQQSGACHAHLDELGHGNVGEVESSYSSHGFGDYHPNGGLPEDYLTQNKVHNSSIYPLVASTIGRYDLVAQDVYLFFLPNKYLSKINYIAIAKIS